jgi:hypothetical protein
MAGLAKDVLTLCDDVSACLRENIRILREAAIDEQVSTHVRDWAVVLGVLSDDVFESVVYLLNADKIRAANMLSRALEDYDVRLRYYGVQSMKARAKYKRKAIKSPKNVSGTIRAARDWDNANYKLVSVLNLYDPALWPPEMRDEMNRVLSSNEEERNNSFSAMLEWLVNHEADVRGVLRIIGDQDKLVFRYSNMLPTWRVQSAFLHGDQVVVSDVLEFNDGAPTGVVFDRSSAPATVILFTAIDNIIELVRSFGMITDSMTPSIEAIRNRAAVLWFKSREQRAVATKTAERTSS